MPVPCLKSARSMDGSFRSASRRKPAPRQGSPSGRLPRMDPALRHWFGVFHQFHTEDDAYTTVALRLLPVGLGSDERGEAGCVEPGPGEAGRCVYEVALHRDAQGERWVVILWEIDVPGIQFCHCADHEEAMALFMEPTKAAGRWHGVRLRRGNCPW
jgi:hypothetical protein